MEESQPPPVNSIEVQNDDPKATPTVTTAGSSLPPTVPYRAAGPGLALTDSLMNSNNNVGGGGGGGASVSTISPGSLNQNPANSSAGNANNAVQFTARDASVLQTPNLNNNANINNDGVISPRSAASRRATLQNSQSNLQNSLASFYATQNTHLEGAFGALMTSIQDHTEELDVHQTNLDR